MQFVFFLINCFLTIFIFYKINFRKCCYKGCPILSASQFYRLIKLFKINIGMYWYWGKVFEKYDFFSWKHFNDFNNKLALIFYLFKLSSYFDQNFYSYLENLEAFIFIIISAPNWTSQYKLASMCLFHGRIYRYRLISVSELDNIGISGIDKKKVNQTSVVNTFFKVFYTPVHFYEIRYDSVY